MTTREISQEWLEARGLAADAVDRFLVKLRMSGALTGTIKTEGSDSPYMQLLNALADLIAP